MALQDSINRPTSYPEGAASERQVSARQRSGSIWATIFMASTLIGIISLLALLYNVVNSAFGYVLFENAIAPSALVQDVKEQALLALPKLTSSEDDEVLAAGIANDPNAIGFFGYAYLQEHTDTLRALSVEGVAPSAETVYNCQYPLARPL
jgi:hypothetical protein